MTSETAYSQPMVLIHTPADLRDFTSEFGAEAGFDVEEVRLLACSASGFETKVVCWFGSLRKIAESLVGMMGRKQITIEAEGLKLEAVNMSAAEITEAVDAVLAALARQSRNRIP